MAALVTILGALLAFAGPGRAHAAATDFVQRCGIHFCVDGRTAYFAGANSYDLFTYGSGSGDTETQYMDKAAIDQQMANMAADGVTVVRTWMFNHESWHGFETAKNTMNEQEWAEFDYILYSAAQHGLRVIPTLENYWTAYGGVNTVLTWEGTSTGNSGNFFNPATCAGCLADYEYNVNYALNRVNHYTGVAYRNDPTIFAWELMNEPRYQDVSTADNTAGTVFRAWEDKVGAYIKGIDPNHMIDNGVEGQGTGYGYGSDNGVPYSYECQSPYIDFCTAHIYPTESWANLSVGATQTLLNAYINDAHSTVGKPFFLGEFNTSASTRATYWPAIYSTLEAGNADADAFWWYENTQKDGTYGVLHGDPVLSVFAAHSAVDKARSGTATSASPTPSASATPTQSASPTPTASATASQSPTSSPSSSATPTSTPSATSAAGPCKVTYVLSDWGTSFNGSVTITNTGSTPVNGWSLVFSFPGAQAITSIWNADYVQTGKKVTATNPSSYNVSIAPGANVNFGFSGTSTPGTNGTPSGFALNGTPCTTG
ncbi:cellulose binding domain-containing protein [Streptacidiphilus cavernicola]|uniref:Cellulose binding domain-containing protein n=1 Tax=Streptacidiphilus cavernicola TaxID=3342716 RepID=A0ABV6VMS7_9ACTN